MLLASEAPWFDDSFFLHGSIGQPQCTNGFLSQDRVRSINSGRRVLDGMLKVRRRQQRIIPMINFTCNGSINKWIVAAKWDNRNDRTFFPRLQVWRRTPGTNMYTLVGSTPTMGATENTSMIYEFVPSSRLQFQQGDILGVFNPDKPRLGIYYVDGGIGPANYHTGTGSSPPNGPFTIVRNTNSQNDLPLIAVETSKLLLAFTSSFDFVL